MRVAGFLLMGLLYSLNANAGEFTVVKDQNFAISPVEILDILVDYENSCDEGCAYRVKGLTETKVLEKTENQHLIWQKIKDVRTVEQFVQNTISRNPESGEISMVSEYPSAKDLAVLKQKTNLSHNGGFKAMNITWRILPTEKGGSRVFCEMKVVHGFPDFISGVIKRAVNNSIDTLFNNFQ